MHLDTKRLKLKTIGLDDVEFIYKHFSDDNVQKYLYDGEPLKDLEEADKLVIFYINANSDYISRWILILKSNNKRIGTCGFHKFNKSNMSIELGYDLQKPYWGKGYMNEAIHAVLDYAKNHMVIRSVKACIYAEHNRSIKFAEKLGFIKTDIEEMLEYQGKEYLHYYFELLL